MWGNRCPASNENIQFAGSTEFYQLFSPTRWYSGDTTVSDPWFLLHKELLQALEYSGAATGTKYLEKQTFLSTLTQP